MGHAATLIIVRRGYFVAALLLDLTVHSGTVRSGMPHLFEWPKYIAANTTLTHATRKPR